MLISKKTAVIGAGDHIEVWDYDAWEVHLGKISAALAE
jgi:DNA-binding transcriptional regulator/RsmH inhibitor MraZ